jgi:hypothetical protein
MAVEIIGFARFKVNRSAAFQLPPANEFAFYGTVTHVQGQQRYLTQQKIGLCSQIQVLANGVCMLPHQ